jgi:dephospho-CoA kinase
MKEIKKELITKTPLTRLYQLSIPVIGLTGGIASGKSTVSQIIRNKGIKVVDADLLVKKIYKEQDSLEFIKSCCSPAIEENHINFKILREHFFSDPQLKVKIEQFIYQKLPLVFNLEISSEDKLVFYDVPLLFEKNLQSFFDKTVLIYCSKETQLVRLVNRDHISKQLAEKILNSQIDIEEKKQLADFVIDNSQEEKELAEKVETFLKQVLN